MITLSQMREKLYSAVVSDALDALGYTNQSPRVQLRRTSGPGGTLVGRCKTTAWASMAHTDPSPYEKELIAIDSCKPDDVFIGAAGGSMHSGLWGELLSTAARNGGCVGAILDGAVRDVARMNAMGFTTYARGTLVHDSLNRQRVVDVDVPVAIDGVRFEPRDLVFADEDGIVVVPQKVEAEAIGRAWEKVHAENITRDAIRGGMKAMEAWKKFGVL